MRISAFHFAHGNRSGKEDLPISSSASAELDVSATNLCSKCKILKKSSDFSKNPLMQPDDTGIGNFAAQKWITNAII